MRWFQPRPEPPEWEIAVDVNPNGAVRFRVIQNWFIKGTFDTREEAQAYINEHAWRTVSRTAAIPDA